MGGGASKGPANQSMAIKEIKERAEKLEREVDKMEQEKKAYEKQLADRASDIEKLGEINRNIEREKEALAAASNNAKQDLKSAEKSMDILRREMDEVKANASKFEATLREIKGDLIVEKEDHVAAREEIERIGQVLTEKVQEKEEVEKRIQQLEEEKLELDNMLRLTSESADMYKDLSSKLMVKKPKEEAPAAAPIVAAPAAKSGETKAQPKTEAPRDGDSSEELLKSIKPKRAGRFKVCIISTFEDFFLERRAIKENAVRPLNEWCDQNGCVLELVDIWEDMLRDQYTAMSSGFYIPSLYFQEIEDADVVLLLLGEKYGTDLPEEACANEANARPWLNRHRAKKNRFGSVLELAAVYAAFVVGHDANLAQDLTPPRVLAYMRDENYILGLPESMMKHFQPEGTRQKAKLNDLKDRIRDAQLVRESAYADPYALSQKIVEDLEKMFEASMPKKAMTDIELDDLTHNAYMDAHAWVGQGEKGVQLPESVSSIMERVRK